MSTRPDPGSSAQSVLYHVAASSKKRRAPITGRPALACERCKQRKIKCSAERPECRRCVRLYSTCIYSAVALPLEEIAKIPRRAKKKKVIDGGVLNIVPSPPAQVRRRSPAAERPPSCELGESFATAYPEKDWSAACFLTHMRQQARLSTARPDTSRTQTGGGDARAPFGASAKAEQFADRINPDPGELAYTSDNPRKHDATRSIASDWIIAAQGGLSARKQPSSPRTTATAATHDPWRNYVVESYRPPQFSGSAPPHTRSTDISAQDGERRLQGMLGPGNPRLSEDRSSDASVHAAIIIAQREVGTAEEKSPDTSDDPSAEGRAGTPAYMNHGEGPSEYIAPFLPPPLIERRTRVERPCTPPHMIPTVLDAAYSQPRCSASPPDRPEYLNFAAPTLWHLQGDGAVTSSKKSVYTAPFRRPSPERNQANDGCSSQPGSKTITINPAHSQPTGRAHPDGCSSPPDRPEYLNFAAPTLWHLQGDDNQAAIAAKNSVYVEMEELRAFKAQVGTEGRLTVPPVAAGHFCPPARETEKRSLHPDTHDTTLPNLNKSTKTPNGSTISLDAADIPVVHSPQLSPALLPTSPNPEPPHSDPHFMNGERMKGRNPLLPWVMRPPEDDALPLPPDRTARLVSSEGTRETPTIRWSGGEALARERLARSPVDGVVIEPDVRERPLGSWSKMVLMCI